MFLHVTSSPRTTANVGVWSFRRSTSDWKGTPLHKSRVIRQIGVCVVVEIVGMVSNAEIGEAHRSRQNGGGLKRRSKLHLVIGEVRVSMGVTEAQTRKRREWILREEHSQRLMRRCSIIVVAIFPCAPFTLYLKSNIDFDPSLQWREIEMEDSCEQALSQIEWLTQKVLAPEHALTLSDLNGHLLEGDRIAMRVFCQDQYGQRLIGFQPVGGICDDLRFLFLQQAKEKWKPVMGLGIQEEREEPKLVKEMIQ